jgi:8-oxo-dGTP pyrophosphatase MutT (NUDIX family)
VHRRPLLELLARYGERHPEERACVARVRALVESRPDCFLRTCLPGHITASAWILSPDHRRFLLTHHRKLDRWLQLGGHADGETEVAAVARREADEESGQGPFAFLGACDPARGPLPVDVDVHAIPARARDDAGPGEPAHEHHDVRFALVASRDAVRLSGESTALRWFEMDALDAVLPALGADASLLRLGRKVRDLLADPAAGRATRRPGRT